MEHRHDDDDDGDDGDVLAHWRRSNANEFAITLSHKKYLIQAGKRNRRYVAGVPPREAVCNQEQVRNQTPGIMDKVRKSKLEEVSTKHKNQTRGIMDKYHKIDAQGGCWCRREKRRRRSREGRERFDAEGNFQ